LPYVPAIFGPFAVAALLTYRATARVRAFVLVGISVPIALAYGQLDVTSMILAAVLLAVAFAAIKLPWNRALLAIGLAGLSLLFLAISARLWPYAALTAAVSFQPGWLPMMWYSVYQDGLPRRRLRATEFILYTYTRFWGGPVVTYPDLFSKSDEARLARLRAGGVKALYIAVVACFGAAACDALISGPTFRTLTGGPLLVASYLGYVGYSLRLVIGFNIVIGTLRLFGVPVRDNFYYWLLARTPNEHWQRWNVLFREWIVTFVFFPIMRTKRWLFAAVMAALLTSCLLHIIAGLMMGRVDGFSLMASITYWSINGLAIYVVLKTPKLFPRLCDAARFATHPAWSVAGVVFTSSFYAVLYGMRVECSSWPQVLDYFERLCRI
jgi:D-alanyl-lipoteichoic acid acyltransferase DltB (MBOAT superfamily)